MARIKIQDYIKDVELNRRRLVNKFELPTNASLGTAVSNILSTVTSNNDLLHEVRWFAGDGTILKTEYVPDGATATPPELPEFYPEYLEFDRWCSIIGDTFDNIQHDVDYAPKYNLLSNDIIVNFTLDDETGLDISPYFGTYNKVSTIDWGDGIVEEYTGSGLRTHTYAQPGTYTYRITSSTQYVSGNPLYGSTSTGSPPDRLKFALNFIITPKFYTTGGYAADFIITNELTAYQDGSYSFPICNMMLIHWSLKRLASGLHTFYGSVSNMIFDINTFIDVDPVNVSSPYSFKGNQEKLLIPRFKLPAPAGKYMVQLTDGSASSYGRNCVIVTYTNFDIGSYMMSSYLHAVKSFTGIKYVNTPPSAITGATHKLINCSYEYFDSDLIDNDFKVLDLSNVLNIRNTIYGYWLQDLYLHPNSVYDTFTVQSHTLNTNSILQILNALKDLSTADTNGTLKLSSKLKKRIKCLKLKLSSANLYEETHDDDYTTFLQVCSDLNWTVSFS